MSNWKDRKTLKNAREILRGSQKWLRINRDLLSSAQQLDITAAILELEKVLAAGNAPAAASKADELEQKIGRTLPARKHSGLRENVEVLLVAVIVAMAVRTFFIQPFKIPTGSMQPTLYGVYPPPGAPPTSYDGESPSIAVRLAGIVFQGRMYETFGYRSRGDHIFVDKFSYHFRKPRRGEVIVFDTGNIPEIPLGSRGKFYIKRLIGLESDAIQITPPYVKVNDAVLNERPAFQRIYSRQNGYNGYVIPEGFPSAPYFRTREDIYRVPQKHLFVLGDNSVSSLDGRFWGSVPQKDLIGRAILVYWPFTSRFGRIE